MTQLDPDYSLYNLEQLYDIQRRIDKERFPQRYAALQREIALKHENPDSQSKTRNYPPCALLLFLGAKPSRQVYPASNALNVARVVVGIEYTLFGIFLALPTLLMVGLFVGAILVAFALYLLLFGGVTILKMSLGAVRDEHSVELWSLIAVGLAPVSAILYTAIAFFVFDQSNHYNASTPILMLSPLIGFYTPFILAVFWVKYHCRDDEF